MAVLSKIARALEVPGEQSLYINDDIKPLPLARRTWSKRTFTLFWLATSINIGGLTGASAILSLGLNVWQAVVTDLISAVIIGFAIVANGQQGGRWHIPFAIGNRAGWGMRGAWFVVCQRLLLSFVWYGYQTWLGGQVVKVMIGTWAPSFYTMKNHFPASAQMETNDFIGFVIFWTLSLPILAIKPERYRVPAILSSIAVTVGVFALLIWALAKQGGGGPLLYDVSKTLGKPRLEGAALGWAMVKSVTSGIGGWAGAIMYQSDFTRYARHEGDQVLGQIAIIPICMVGSSFVGLLITSCAAGFYPEHGLLWRPYKLMEVIQTEAGNSSGSRAAIFFLCLTFLCSQACVNVAGNAISGSIDLATLLPRWVDGRRGPYIVAVVAFAVNPWRFINTANAFISVVSSFSIFLGPLAGIMMADYFLIRKQQLKLSDLYRGDRESIYWFTAGFNLRAFAVWALAMFPSFPGFLYTVSSGSIYVSPAWQHTAYLGWILGWSIAGSLWYGINTLFPPPGLGEVDDEDIFDTFGEDDSSINSVPDEEKKGDAPAADAVLAHPVEEPSLTYQRA